MAHYAMLDENNVVVNVIVGRDETDVVDGVSDWEEYYSTDTLTAKRTSYNTFGNKYYNSDVRELADDQSKAFRKNFAIIGGTYDPQLDAFIPPRPEFFPSWILDEETCQWVAPVPDPNVDPQNDGDPLYDWDEDTLSWVQIAQWNVANDHWEPLNSEV